MKITAINAGLFKLDGGAMHGIIPKVMWEKKNPPDEKNLCVWTMRCLLVQTADRRILVDTGMGTKMDPKFARHFHPHGDDDLLKSLHKTGVSPHQITDVLLTHLHFDHVGGAVTYDGEGQLVPTFPNATYWSNERHWNWAMEPNAREKASFLKENFVPLREQGCVQWIPVTADDHEWMPNINIRFVYGHTEAMMVPIFELGERRAVYCADVMPSATHLSLPWVMGYDLRPLATLREKQRILTEAVQHKDLLIFEHGKAHAAVTVTTDQRGRYVSDQAYVELSEAFDRGRN